MALYDFSVVEIRHVRHYIVLTLISRNDRYELVMVSRKHLLHINA